MDDTSSQIDTADETPAPVRELTRPQRRVLGVLLEKGFTTPEYYPLTLKAVTTGCNQKSNRDPVSNYSEDAVEETLDQLRELGLVAVVHTESGRTERFRHFMRKRYTFAEPQFAILTELLLRGRQSLGELRSRASRMVPIDSLEDLRDHLQQLADEGYIRASGPLERRGVEVDHGFYPPGEAPAFVASDLSDSGSSSSSTRQSAAAVTATASPSGSAGIRPSEFLELQTQVEELTSQVAQLTEDVAELRRSLGV